MNLTLALVIQTPKMPVPEEPLETAGPGLEAGPGLVQSGQGWKHKTHTGHLRM